MSLNDNAIGNNARKFMFLKKKTFDYRSNLIINRHFSIDKLNGYFKISISDTPQPIALKAALCFCVDKMQHQSHLKGTVHPKI